MAKILYLHRDPSWAGFIAADLRILRRRHEVIDFPFRYSPAAVAELMWMTRKVDLVYFWWGDITGTLGVLAAKMHFKRSIMVTGGYDVVSIPEINYGLRNKRFRKYLPEVPLSIADRIIVNAGSTRQGIVEAFRLKPERVISIPHGVDPEIIGLGPNPRDRLVLTIGQVNRSTIFRKGIETFVLAAASLPDTRFVVAGPLSDEVETRELQARAPKNVEFTGFLDREVLYSIMQTAAVIVQVSAHEGFGLALAEAMLAGATPVVTKRGALPEVVGDVGHYVDYGDVSGTAAAIERALSEPQAERSRARIQEHFPLHVREVRLLELIDEVLN